MPAPSADRDSDATRDDVTVPRPTTDFGAPRARFTRTQQGGALPGPDRAGADASATRIRSLNPLDPRACLPILSSWRGIAVARGATAATAGFGDVDAEFVTGPDVSGARFARSCCTSTAVPSSVAVCAPTAVWFPAFPVRRHPSAAREVPAAPGATLARLWTTVCTCIKACSPMAIHRTALSSPGTRWWLPCVRG